MQKRVTGLPASVRRTMVEPAGVVLVASVAGILIGLVTGLLIKGAFEGVVIGLLSTILLQLVLDSHRRAVYEEKLGFLLKADGDRDFSPALRYAEQVAAALEQADQDAKRFAYVRKLVSGYLNEGTWREASQQRYPIRREIESEFTATALPSAERTVCATDPDLTWWQGKEAQEYLDAHREFLQAPAGLRTRAQRARSIRRVFILAESHIQSVRKAAPTDGTDPVEAILAEQLAAGVAVRVLVRPDDRYDCVIYDSYAVRYANEMPTGGRSVSAKLSTVPSDVVDWQRFFNEAWTAADDPSAFLGKYPPSAGPGSGAIDTR